MKEKLSKKSQGVVESVTDGDRLLTPGETAAAFGVDVKTVTRWAKAGKLKRILTPGGHSRFRESDIQEMTRVEKLD